MEFAINFLKSNAGIDSPTLLSSPFPLVTLGYYGHKPNYQIGAEEWQRLRHWVLVANAKGRYSRGSSETLLDPLRSWDRRLLCETKPHPANRKCGLACRPPPTFRQ
jgi:hypothetical protein